LLLLYGVQVTESCSSSGVPRAEYVGPHAGRGSGVGLRGPQRQGRSMGASLRSSREVRCAVPCRNFRSCPAANRRLLKLSGLALALSGGAHARAAKWQPQSPLVGGRPMVHSGRIFFFGKHVTITSPLKRYLARAALGRLAAGNQTEGKLRSGLCGPRGPVRPAGLRGFRFAGSRPKTRGSLRQSETGSASVSRALDSELHGCT
jgi:hypothetical protein